MTGKLVENAKNQLVFFWLILSPLLVENVSTDQSMVLSASNAQTILVHKIKILDVEETHVTTPKF